jgi:RNA polymerase sigma-70 factor (ECF subfamily)
MAGISPALVAAREADAAAASAVKAMQAAGQLEEARERYAELVARHQRRAGRIAYHYLRDAAEADEAVQDAFVKAYQHLASFREELPFDVWFTRILINGCLDRIKARTRRERWLLPMTGKVGGSRGTMAADAGSTERDVTERVAAGGLSPEQALLGRERRREIAAALSKLPERQRSVFVLSHVEGRTSREVSALTGLNESTVRVHLFRAIRKLRTLLAPANSDTAAEASGELKGKRRVTS